jgi:hypothetical protein
MKRTTFVLVVAALVVTSVTGCYLSPVVPPTGMIYTEFSAPQNPGAKGDLGSKSGKAEARSFLGLIAYGDASVSAAADAGDIATVKHTDYDFFNVLGIYQRYTTVVYGD